jgi:hypothetical protein
VVSRSTAPQKAVTLRWHPPEVPSGLCMPGQGPMLPPQCCCRSPLLLSPAPAGSWERRSGEEMGAHGYWYRWTEVRGCDDAGVVQVG